MSENKEYYSVSAILLLVLSLLIPSTARAQALSYSLSPPISRVVIKPGATVDVPLHIRNFGDPVIVKLNLTAVQPGELEALKPVKQIDNDVKFLTKNTPIQLNESFILKSNENRQITVTLSTSENATAGDHYFALTAENQSPAVTEGNATTYLNSQLSSYFFVSITQDAKTHPQVKIVAFDTPSKSSLSLLGSRYKIFDSAQEVPIVLITQNYDKFLTEIEGKIKLKGFFGNIKSYNIIPALILSGSQKTLVADQLSIGNNSSTLTLPAKLFGIYSLEATLHYGQKSGTIYSTTRFIALPFNLFQVLLGLFIVVSGILYLLHKKRNS